VSIVSKVLVLFVVVLALGLSVMLGTYATVTSNYKQAYEESLKQLEAASVNVLGKSVDEFSTKPLAEVERALKEGDVRVLTSELSKAAAKLKEAEDNLKFEKSKGASIEEPLRQLQAKLDDYQKLLAAAQDYTKQLQGENTQKALQLAAAEKKANENEVRARFREAEVAVLKAQNKNQDERIRSLEKKVAMAEQTAEQLAVVVQTLKSSSVDSGVGGSTLPGITSPGLEGNAGSISLGMSGGKGRLILNEAPKIRGRVSEVRSSGGVPYAIVNVGEDDKVVVGQELSLFRVSPPTYLGKLVVTRVDYQQAAGRIELVKPELSVAPGDEVTNNLRSIR
jgi:hypothetical protein